MTHVTIIATITTYGRSVLYVHFAYSLRDNVFKMPSVCRDRGEAWRQLPPPLNFWAVEKLSENLLLVGKFLSKNAKFGTEPPFGKFRGKIETFSTHNFLCQKLEALCRNSVGTLQLFVRRLRLSVPRTF